MSRDIQHLENLARMAKESSSEGRLVLLREVTDLFLEEPDSLNESEIVGFDGVMNILAAEVEIKARKHLAEQLAEIDAAPPDIIHRLAADDIAVAQPVLIQSSVLKDDVLLDIIKKQGQEHMLAITKREVVSETVSDAIVEKGNDEVLESLASNDGAQLSTQAMQTMVQRSENSVALNEAMRARQDVPGALVERLMAHVSTALKKQLLASGHGMDEGQIDAIIAETQVWLAEENESSGQSAADRFIARKRKLGQLNNEMLLDLLRKRKLPELICGLAELSMVDKGLVRQCLGDVKGEKLLVICRALDMTPSMFEELSTTLGVAGDAEQRSKLLGLYGRITPDSAQRSLRFLRTRLSTRSRMAAEIAPA